jgi:hypothetical protein
MIDPDTRLRMRSEPCSVVHIAASPCAWPGRADGQQRAPARRASQCAAEQTTQGLRLTLAAITRQADGAALYTLHRHLGKAPGTRLTDADLAAEESKGGVFARRAQFAKNAKRWKHSSAKR